MHTDIIEDYQRFHLDAILQPCGAQAPSRFKPILGLALIITTACWITLPAPLKQTNEPPNPLRLKTKIRLIPPAPVTSTDRPAPEPKATIAPVTPARNKKISPAPVTALKAAPEPPIQDTAEAPSADVSSATLLQEALELHAPNAAAHAIYPSPTQGPSKPRKNRLFDENNERINPHKELSYRSDNGCVFVKKGELWFFSGCEDNNTIDFNYDNPYPKYPSFDHVPPSPSERRKPPSITERLQ